jgi:hypothetical protein
MHYREPAPTYDDYPRIVLSKLPQIIPFDHIDPDIGGNSTIVYNITRRFTP